MLSEFELYLLQYAERFVIAHEKLVAALAMLGDSRPGKENDDPPAS